MKKVLIALDYNPSAQKIAETGYALAKTLGAEVVLLHVMEDSAYYSAFEYSPIMGFNNFILPDNAAITETYDEIKKGAVIFLEKSKEHLADQNIRTIIAEGDTASTIIKTAADLQSDIIVLGSHSHRGLEKILMGSVAEKSASPQFAALVYYSYKRSLTAGQSSFAINILDNVLTLACVSPTGIFGR